MWFANANCSWQKAAEKSLLSEAKNLARGREILRFARNDKLTQNDKFIFLTKPGEIAAQAYYPNRESATALRQRFRVCLELLA